MRKMGWVGTAVILVLATAGCYEHTYTTGAGAPVGPLVYQEWHNHWIAGLIGERDMSIDEFCPSGNATIRDEHTFLNGLVAVLTSGIYTPTTMTIRCDTGRSAEVDLEGRELITILRSPAFLERVEVLIPERLGEAQVGVRGLQP